MSSLYLKHLKVLSRLATITEYTFSQYLPTLTGLILSLVTINYFSQELWGEFISYQIYINLALMLIAFGSNSYDLRAFSKKSNLVSALWNESFYSRGIILFIVLTLLFLLPFSLTTKLALFIWIGSSFIIQSFLPLIIYNKKFKYLIYSEIFSLIILLSIFIIFFDTITLEKLLLYRAISVLVKSAALIMYFKKEVEIQWSGWPNMNYLKRAYKFFFLALVGSLSTKVGLYLVINYLSSDLVGSYHVFSTLVIILHSTSRLITDPFIKSAYRLNFKSIRKLDRNLSIIGVFIVTIGMTLIRFILFYFYKIDFPILYYALSGLYIYASYISTGRVHWFFKNDKEQWIIMLNIISIALNTTIVILLINTYSLVAILIGACISRWLVTVIVIWLSRRLEVSYEPV